MSKNYFQITYQGPFQGVNTELPEDVIPSNASPFLNNFTLKHGEIRTRPRQDIVIPGTPDNLPILLLKSFVDQNNVTHTCAVTPTGLWQLNSNWNNLPITPRKTWQLVGNFKVTPGPNFPVNSSIFVDKLFWTNGGSHLWMWDGISSVGSFRTWGPLQNFRQGDVIIDSNGNFQTANNAGRTGSGAHPVWGNTLGAQTVDSTITWTENGKAIPTNAFVDACIVDATNGLTAGGLFLVELNAQLLLCNTVESTGSYPQRVRWCPSGLPTIWDPNVNLGAGFNDELDVPDSITGAFSVGTTAFIIRTNGVTEVTSTGQGENPFNFNHLWASDRGIGNVFSYGYASYGPVGTIISEDEIYTISMGGFKKIGKQAKDNIYGDLAKATQTPIACILPHFHRDYLYHHYRLSIAQGTNIITWKYVYEDERWERESRSNTNHSGFTNSVLTL